MFKLLLPWVFGLLILLQAVQIKIPPVPNHIDPKSEIEAPKNIAPLLQRSCYDCHSYQTKMPWYGNIVPFSLEVQSHIKEGREWLNFQEWKSYNEEKKQKIYKGILKTIDFSMPMPMYLKLHENAKLSTEEREMIKQWAQSHIKE